MKAALRKGAIETLKECKCRLEQYSDMETRPKRRMPFTIWRIQSQLNEAPLAGAHQGGRSGGFCVFTSNAVWDSGLSSRLVTVYLAHQTNSLCNVLVHFGFNRAIRIGHQVNSSCLTNTGFHALMLRDSSGETCFCPAVAGLCSSTASLGNKSSSVLCWWSVCPKQMCSGQFGDDLSQKENIWQAEFY